MLRLGVILVLFISVLCEDTKVVKLDYGIVSGEKYWNGDFYQFYGVPYASIPTGRDRFKGPLPPKPWEGVLSANLKSKICHQCYFTGDSDEIMLDGEEDCLLINVLSPLVASEDNLLPVVVYIHSGAFSGGSGNMAIFHYLARHDVLTVSFNYRLGAFGFVCLGNEDIPGNAGLKDQVAALRWIQDNIKKFGGDPNRVTLAGFSVGAAMAELLSFSKSTTGLFNKLILESGSAFSPFTINRDPVATARNIAYSLGYNGTDSVEELTEFYLNAEVKDLAEKSVNYHLKNSTFGFAPCIENLHEGMEAILLESPTDVIKKGEQNEVTVLTGFSNMEGISRTVKFGSWREAMNENFADFLPADLKFDSDKSKDDFVKAIKKRYFNNKDIHAESLQNYVDYFSDSMFKYGIMKSAKLHANLSKRPVYLYEFTYVGKLNIEHNYMDRLKGASHRDQTAYVLDFFGITNNYKDLDMRERMTTMWTDFVKYENPTPFESSLITVKWLPYTNQKRNHLEINKKLQPKKNLFEDAFNFWNNIYEKYYWNPLSPKFVKTENKKNDLKSESDGKHNNDGQPKSNTSTKNDVKTENDSKPKDEVKTNTNLKSKNVVKADDGVNLNNDVKPNINAQTEEGIKSKSDVKPNNNDKPQNVKSKSNVKSNNVKSKSDVNSGSDVKSTDDVNTSSDIKPVIVDRPDGKVEDKKGVKSKSDPQLNERDTPESDVKPNQIIKPDNDVKSKGDDNTNKDSKPKRNVKPNNVQPKSDVKSDNNVKSKEDVKTSSEVKPEIVARPDGNVENKKSVKSKSDIKSDNDVKSKDDVKTSSDVKPEIVARPAGNVENKKGVKSKSDVKSDNDVKSKDDVKTSSEVKPEIVARPAGNVENKKGVKSKSDVKSVNDVKSKDDVKTSTVVKPEIVARPDGNVENKKGTKSKTDPQLNKSVTPESNVKPNKIIEPDNNVKSKGDDKSSKHAKPKSDVKPNNVKSKTDVKSDNDVKSKGDDNTNKDAKPKSDVKSDNDVKSKDDVKTSSDIKPEIVDRPDGNVENKNGIKSKSDPQLNENITPKRDVKPNKIVKPDNDVKSKGGINTSNDDKSKSDVPPNNNIKLKSDDKPKEDLNSKNKVNSKEEK